MNSKKDVFLEEKFPKMGESMYQLMEKLFPICRSITGNGVRDTLKIIKNFVNIKIFEIPSGAEVFDWTIPKEWNINDAYVIDPNGEKIIDFKKSNLHVVSYSLPIDRKVSLMELKEHLHTIPEKPDVIPYVTSYYSKEWGFCITHNQFLNLKEGEYHVVIDSKLDNGSLTYGEYIIPGKNKEEILLTCYVCHPSMCNDNLSGIVLLTFLAKYLNDFQLNYSIRFLFVPETIGAITWIHKNEQNLSKIKHGLVATCLGDPGKFTYKKSRNGDNEIDKIVTNILEKSSKDYKITEFFPWGSDERQFCSPAFDLPIGSLMRSMYGTNDFPEYHTSADNLSFVNEESLGESFKMYLKIIFELDKNFPKSNENFLKKEKKKVVNSEFYENLNPKCEPQLIKKQIHRKFGGQKNSFDERKEEQAMFWVLNLSDGNNSIADIVQKSGLDENMIRDAIDILVNSDLLKKIS